MDNFKKLPKMQHFKEGGSVQTQVSNFTKRDRKVSDSADIAQDKAIVKKAISIHDKQEHPGEKTDLSSLKKGGRSKKAVGTVNKYKSGGSVTNVYEAKKSSGDLDNIRKTKDIKPAKAAAPSKAALKPAFKGSDVAKEKNKPAGHKDPIKKVTPTGNKKAAAPSGAKGPDAYKCGGNVKKMAVGGPTFQTNPAGAQDALDTQDNIATRNMIMNPARRAKKFLMDKLSGIGGLPGAMATPSVAPTGPTSAPGLAPAPTPALPAQKKGGKVKGKC